VSSETSSSSLRIESLAIGDELLDGRVLDSNTKFLGDTLSVLGLELCGARIVPDDRSAIVDAVNAAVDRADVVVTSGGLGPTSDDITAECIAEAAGVGLRFDEPAFARMTAMFAARGIPMPESNRRQAMLPASSRTLENQMGTAPGFVTPFVRKRADGSERVVEVWSFPGVPREYQHLRDDFFLPALSARQRGAKKSVLVRRTLRSLGLAESAIGERLAPLEKANPDVRVQYRAAFPEIIIRLVLVATSAEGADGDGVDAADRSAVEVRADALAKEAEALIGKSVFGHGDESLEERVLTALRKEGYSIVTAESCTGGLVAKRLTDIAGSSDVVRGGVVAYANAVKVSALGVGEDVLVEHGAVSEPVARAMAQGARVRLNADVAVSITGVAGPGGGSADKPVGTVWFGVSTPKKTLAVLKKLPDFGRDRVREMAAATALRLVLDTLSE
jgi:nicotinamide-nucleotide amidase